MLETDSNYRVQSAYSTHWPTTRSPSNGYNDAYQGNGYDNARDLYRPTSVHVARTNTSSSPFGLPPASNSVTVGTSSPFHSLAQKYPYSPPPSYGWQQSTYPAAPSNGYGAIGSSISSYNHSSNANGTSALTGSRGGYRVEDEPRTREILAKMMPMSIDADGMDRPSNEKQRQSSFSPTGSADGMTVESPSMSDLSMDGGPFDKTPPNMSMSQAGFAAGLNEGSRSRPSRRGGNRDEFDGPHQLLPRPAPQYIAQQERELPHLPTHLHVEEQDQVLSQVNDRLSRCAFDFVARYQFPIPLTQDMRRVSRPQDREWTEWVQLLKRLATKRRIPARVLYNNQIKQFVTILENSLEMRHAARHQSRPLKDDRNILQLISAGIQVAKILKDAPAMDFLDRLYVATDKQIQERSAAAAARFRS